MAAFSPLVAQSVLVAQWLQWRCSKPSVSAMVSLLHPVECGTLLRPCRIPDNHTASPSLMANWLQLVELTSPALKYSLFQLRTMFLDSGAQYILFRRHLHWKLSYRLIIFSLAYVSAYQYFFYKKGLAYHSCFLCECRVNPVAWSLI